MATEQLYIREGMAYYEREHSRVWTKKLCTFAVPGKTFVDPAGEYSLELKDGCAILWNGTHIATSRSTSPMAVRWRARDPQEKPMPQARVPKHQFHRGKHKTRDKSSRLA